MLQFIATAGTKVMKKDLVHYMVLLVTTQRAMRACRNGQGNVKHTRFASCSHQIQQVISFSKTKPNAIWKLEN